MDKPSVEWEAMQRAHWNRSTSSSDVRSANSQLEDSRHANESRIIYHGHSGCAQLFYGFVVLAPLGFVAIKKLCYAFLVLVLIYFNLHILYYTIETNTHSLGSPLLTGKETEFEHS